MIRTLVRSTPVVFPILFYAIFMAAAFLSTSLRRSTIGSSSSCLASAFVHEVPARSSQSRFASASTTTPSADEGGNGEGDQPQPKLLSKRLDGLDAPTVWHEFSPLAVEHGSINLGQGFPDWDPPPFLVDELRRSTDPKHPETTRANQYARSYAHLPLARALRDDYVRYQWKDSGLPDEILEGLDPATNVATATGVTNVLYCALQGLIDPGDEVVLLEPFFDIYSSQVKLAGGIPVYCPLRSAPAAASAVTETSEESETKTKTTTTTTLGASEFFTLDLDELASTLTPRTKVLIINTPHNPTGKMFSRSELEGIADLVTHHNNNNNNNNSNNLVVLADEVYQHIVFDPETEPHVSIATVNGGQIWDHTLTMSSAGKTFSCTGWKVGWAIGPAHLIQAVTAVQQWCNFSPVTPTQDAIARALVVARQPYRGYDSYYDWLAADYGRKRGILIDALEMAGSSKTNDNENDSDRGAVFRAVIPNGGFFVMADTSSIDFPYDRIAETQVTAATPRMVLPGTSETKMPRDWALSRWLTTTVGVTAIPPSAFYGTDHLHLASDTLRFAFCKNEATLEEASLRLRDYFAPGDGGESSSPSSPSSPEPTPSSASGDGSGDDDHDGDGDEPTTTGESPPTPDPSNDSTTSATANDASSSPTSPSSTESPPPLTSAILRISFDGSKFTGWSAANKGADQREVRRRKRGRRRGYVEDFHHGKLPAGFVRSVEGVLRDNFAKLYGDVDPHTRIVVEGCSRTDKGVHATGMIAQVYCLREGWDETENENENETVSRIPGKRLPHPSTPTDDSCFEPLPMKGNLSKLAFSFNRMRPTDIQITGIAPTPSTAHKKDSDDDDDDGSAKKKNVFHASLSSRSKTYEYRLATGFLKDPTQRKSSWHVRSELDLEAMQSACELLTGTHDFSAFRGAARGPDEKRRRLREKEQQQQQQQQQQQHFNPSCVCTLYHLSIEEHDPLGIHEDYYFPRSVNGNDDNRNHSPMKHYRIVVDGDRFLYKMVRFVVGALVAVGQGKLSRDDLARALDAGSWSDGDGKRTEFECAPAHGLTLAGVDYGRETVFDWQPLRDPSLEQRKKRKQRLR